MADVGKTGRHCDGMLAGWKGWVKGLQAGDCFELVSGGLDGIEMNG